MQKYSISNGVNIHEEINKIETYALGEISKTANTGELENLRVKYLGRNGNITQILRGLERYPDSERRAIGAEANKARMVLESEIDKRQKYLAEMEYKNILESERLDVTATLGKIPAGHLHPVTKTLEKAEKIFSSMGFEIVDGPEIETEFYNFDALNIPESHPSRDMWDTFWLKPEGQKSKVKSQKLLMRTHTSPVQVRYMEAHKPPFRIIVPGRCFRHEATDASHESTFYQVEGLMIGSNITIANIKSIFETFLRNFFEKDVRVKLRPSFFPFVEPGLELLMNCGICEGKGCRVCKQSGWIEVIPCGMVHHNVLKGVGIDPKKWQGFAFGMGFDRLTMMQHGIDDIRLFHSGDLRFLEQF